MAPYQDPAGVDVDFRNISRCHKAYRKYCQSQVAAYGFTPGEVDVLTVLSNNPQIDTAADISQFRNISKALVCRSVDALVRQGFLLSAPDERDRRLQHLSLTEEAAPIAAALQEYDCATLVGTHTTGKGRAQQTFELSDGSAANLSVEEYFTPNGNSLADVGIAPDIEVTLTEEQQADFYFLAPEDDPQLQKAVETVR